MTPLERGLIAQMEDLLQRLEQVDRLFQRTQDHNWVDLQHRSRVVQSMLDATLHTPLLRKHVTAEAVPSVLTRPTEGNVVQAFRRSETGHGSEPRQLPVPREATSPSAQRTQLYSLRSLSQVHEMDTGGRPRNGMV